MKKEETEGSASMAGVCVNAWSQQLSWRKSGIFLVEKRVMESRIWVKEGRKEAEVNRGRKDDACGSG